MGVIEGWAQDLAPGNVLEGARDSSFGTHGRGFDGFAIAKALKAGPGRPKEKYGLDQIALGLLDGQGGHLGGVKGALGLDPVHGQRELVLKLGQAYFRKGGVPASYDFQ
jgi:hypothetical protein